MGRRRLRKVILDSKVTIIFLAHLAEASVDRSGLVNHGEGGGCGAVNGNLGKGVPREGGGVRRWVRR